MIYPKTGPYFVFPDISSNEELGFEKLSLRNFEQLYQMFRDDKNSFTDARFKNYEGAKNFANDLEQYRAYSPKHGGQDWLYLYKGEYAGVLHLYDISLESFNENNRRCWIGFATTPGMRNLGITKKVVSYFIKYIFENYPLIKYLHSMTSHNNLASQALLKSVGFKQDPDDGISEEMSFYLLERTK